MSKSLHSPQPPQLEMSPPNPYTALTQPEMTSLYNEYLVLSIIARTAEPVRPNIL